MSAQPLLGEGLAAREIRVRDEDVVFVKGVLEASEGLGVVFAERGGALLVVTPVGRDAEIEELLADLERDLGSSFLRGL